MTLPSYSSPFAIGHRAIQNLFEGTVLIQEKVDGSQISFGIDKEGEVRVRSKGAQLNMVAPDKMFARGVEAILAVKDKLVPGYVYRGEYLMKAKHNVLVYERTPKGHIAIFDIEDLNQGDECYLDSDSVIAEATRLGFDAVPVFHQGQVSDPMILREFLEEVSFLGGCKIEGVVVKNYSQYTPDKKVAMGKFVSEAFKEVHAGEWRAANPTQGDIQAALIRGLRTPARWEKAVQHLREHGVITDTPKDIGALIKETQTDIKKECQEEIKEALYAHFLPHILRGVVVGLPEWYKEKVGILSLTAASP